MTADRSDSLSSQRPKRRQPRGLGAAGKALWADVTADYSLRADEIRVLEAACRTADTVATLDDAIRDQPLMTKGSMGQLRENPLISEARQQRTALARFLAQLKLPDTDGGAVLNQHRAAAQSRWAAAHGRSGA